MFDINAIKPTEYPDSGKYSAGLYRFCKRGVHGTKQLKAVTYLADFNFDDPSCWNILIGALDDDGWLYGNRLSAIATIKRPEIFASPPSMITADISDWFWPLYFKIGRALWDVKGSLGSADRFDDFGDYKICKWSGRIYEKRIETIERTHWDYNGATTMAGLDA